MRKGEKGLSASEKRERQMRKREKGEKMNEM
jgi:hypothetical protein